MFAPKPFDVAKEMVRVTKPGGQIVMGNWIPNDPTFVSQLLRISSAFTPPPPEGFVSPMTWGVESHIIERFAQAGVPKENISMVTDTYYFAHSEKSPTEFIELFEKFYGPTMNAVDAARKNGKEEELHKQLVELANAQNKSNAGTFIPATFMRVTVTLNKTKEISTMSMLRPDPTFYPSPKMAMQAPPERLAYVALLNDGKNGNHDSMGVVDLDPSSSAYGRMVGQVDFGRGDNELHHFGWNACSACLCPQSPHPHMERRYLIVPGIGSSRIYILDTKPNPRQPKIVKVIEPEEFIKKTGYTAPHTFHCGPDAIYGSALGSASGDGPGGIFLMDANTFELKGPWERDRGPQQLAYDFWWHLGHDTMITSEWGTPNMVKDGVNPELLLAGKYGHKIHVWDLDKRRH